MKRSVLMACLFAGLILGGFGSVLARGPCRAERVNDYLCALGDDSGDGTTGANVVLLLDRRCVNEDRKCRRQNTCQTVTLDVECRAPDSGDGDPSTEITIGVGCFCGGGSAPLPRTNPVTVDEALRIIRALEAAEAENAAICEVPPEPTAK